MYDWTTNFDPDKWPIEENGELKVPPVPSVRGFIRGDSQIAWDSEIIQSFAELTDITDITFHSYVPYEDSLEDFTYEIEVASLICYNDHHEQCVPPKRHFPWYIWTKEGFQIQIKIFRFKIKVFIFSIF